jgi:hypothetical protein
MDSPKKTENQGVEAIAIDYDRVDVAGIMDQIKKIAAAAPPEEANFSNDLSSSFAPAAPPGASGIKDKIRAWMSNLIRPFFPLIRFIGLPLHQDIRATQESLHETNKRLDKLTEMFFRLEEKLDRVDRDLNTSMEYIRLLHNLGHNLVVELTKLKIEADTLKGKFRILEKDQDQLQRRERTLEDKMIQ